MQGRFRLEGGRHRRCILCRSHSLRVSSWLSWQDKGVVIVNNVLNNVMTVNMALSNATAVGISVDTTQAREGAAPQLGLLQGRRMVC